jgi:hypothetical protein
MTLAAETLTRGHGHETRWKVSPSRSELLSLSRLNYGLPRSQAYSEVVQGTTEFHHQIANP